MLRYLLARLGQAVLTVFAVITVTFGLIRLMPGGPMAFLRARMGREIQVDDVDQMRAIMEVYINMRPDRPLLEQYVNYMVSTLQGDLGRSIVHNEPVAEIYLEALPWTAFVMGISVVLFWVIGVVSGAVMAYSEESRLDIGGSLLAIVCNSIPYYVYAVLFVFAIGNVWGILPAGGRYGANVEPGFNIDFLASVGMHAILPIASVVLASWGGAALGMRANSISVLGEDFVRVARLRGVPTSRVALRYVGRNAILPLYTRFMITIGFLLGGSVILEEIFRYQGVGFYLFRAVSSRDYPMLMGGFLIITLAVVAGILIADLTYGKVDPRVTVGGESQ